MQSVYLNFYVNITITFITKVNLQKHEHEKLILIKNMQDLTAVKSTRLMRE